MPIPKAWVRRTNLLCIRLGNMGDVLMATPAIRALKESVPGRAVTLLTSAAGAMIAKLVPEVDRIIEFDAPWTKRKPGTTHGMTAAAINSIAAERFDVAVIFTAYSQSPLPAAVLCHMAGVPHVLAYCRENPYALISEWVPDPEPDDDIRHEVERQLDLVAAMDAHTQDTRLSLDIPDQTRVRARLKLSGMGLNPDRRWCIMHTSASEAKRLYSAEGFVRAAAQLIREEWQVVLTGSPAEQNYIRRIHRALAWKAINAAGSLSVEELAAAIDQTDIVVSNNTGLVHMAAATNTPVVVLYAQTNPQHTPWQVPHRVLYFPVPPGLRTQNRLLQHIAWPEVPPVTPEHIVQAVHELTEKEAR